MQKVVTFKDTVFVVALPTHSKINLKDDYTEKPNPTPFPTSSSWLKLLLLSGCAWNRKKKANKKDNNEKVKILHYTIRISFDFDFYIGVCSIL